MGMERDENEPLNHFFLLGALGDLSTKKLLPALYQLDAQGLLHQGLHLHCAGRDAMALESFLAMVEKQLKSKDAHLFCPQAFFRFAQRIRYVSLDVSHALEMKRLFEGIDDAPSLFYFAVPPEHYRPICAHLHDLNRIHSHTRVVLEKPIGHDGVSSQAINDGIGEYLTEEQIYRIDHYLGKETVLNLLALRFANALFTANWDQSVIDYVTLSVAESVGIEGRFSYYNHAGQLRDMVQNHLLQVLCLIAMEPPSAFDAQSIRDEKVKVMKALRPIDKSNCKAYTLRGQYQKGVVANEPVKGYREEHAALSDSMTETYAGLCVHIDNWRWRGVPFYLQTGKRMHSKCSEIVIHFKPVIHPIFPQHPHHMSANQLVIRLQPDEGIRLHMVNKRPGLDAHMSLQPTALDLSFKSSFPEHRLPDAYERLLLDAMHGNQSHFVRRDETEYAWRFIDGITHAWEEVQLPLHPYAAGSKGPSAQNGLFQQKGHHFYESPAMA